MPHVCRKWTASWVAFNYLRTWRRICRTAEHARQHSQLAYVCACADAKCSEHSFQVIDRVLENSGNLFARPVRRELEDICLPRRFDGVKLLATTATRLPT